MPQALNAYVDEWERVRRLRQATEPTALTHIREGAFDRFRSRGFPTTREEEWRFTSVAAIAEREFSLGGWSEESVTRDDVAPFRFAGALAAELVFVNGRYAPTLSRTSELPGGARVESLGERMTARGGMFNPHLAHVAALEQHPFAALNTAFFDDGAHIALPPGVVLDRPIHLLFLAANGGSQFDGSPSRNSRPIVAHPRVLVILGANAQATIVETFAGPAGARYFTNAVTEVVLDENAVLHHYKLQYESAEAYHIGSVHAHAYRNATCTSHSVSMGGALVRNDIVAVLNGEGAECTLNGLYMADAQRLVDHHTTIDHAQPHCSSREVYKGILAGHARGVFNGKIIVRPDAQKTDGKQTNRALLLSEDALVNTKPQLEIFANDVKCTHGAAVGQLDDEALFYLRSRGLNESVARQMLIRAFAADVLNRIPLQAVRAGIEERLQRELARALPAREHPEGVPA